MISKYKAIIWDWNGTLLDDLDISISSINELLRARSIPQIDVKRYRETFTFPVQEYYEAIGFDLKKEEFEIPSQQFIDKYWEKFHNTKLQNHALLALNKIQKCGIDQYVLSAMEHQKLKASLAENNIDGYFTEVLGLKNNLAISKIENGINLMQNQQLNPNEICLIGDTLHDFEVAQTLGCDCILVANGHQSRERIEQSSAQIVENISEIIK